MFRERGIDPYWAPDGRRIVYESFEGRQPHVDVRDLASGSVARNVMPVALGDYFSWGSRNGRDIILTINGNYVFLRGDRATAPLRVPACGRYGEVSRPLISKDGSRITTFSRGTIVVRNTADCSEIVDTKLEGAKADFSWDGRYIAFHAPKSDGTGYQIRIVDLVGRTVRDIALSGSALFPSWTRDGRLCFRYDGPDYRGFVIASNVLAVHANTLNDTAVPRLSHAWSELFPATERPPHKLNLVLVWATWSAHSANALQAARGANEAFARGGLDAEVLTATDVASLAPDVARFHANALQLRQIPISPGSFVRTQAANQIPTTLLFRGDSLVGARLGAQTEQELERWVSSAASGGNDARQQ